MVDTNELAGLSGPERAELAHFPPIFPELEDLHEATYRILERIGGREIEQELVSLARIGGRPIEPTAYLPERYATNRLAISELDEEARMHVAQLMERAGMEVDSGHPLGVFGILRGSDLSLDPVLLISHTDTVPNGDMYDGTTGVIAAVKVVEAIQAEDIKPKRTIIVGDITGEESAGYNTATFGSRSLFHGLDDKSLDSRKAGGLSIREALGADDAQTAQYPIFGPKGDIAPTPHAVIELHVEQGDLLAGSGIDLGVVEVIAGPRRFKVEIGETAIPPDSGAYAKEKYFKLRVGGQAAHSGTTPMGEEYRADGLAETARCLLPLINQYLFRDGGLSIGDVQIDGQAMNKVPGITETMIKMSGQSEYEIATILSDLKAIIDERNRWHEYPGNSKFDGGPLTLEEIEHSAAGAFFSPIDSLVRYKAAFELIDGVKKAATAQGSRGVVGTVGTFNVLRDGRLALDLDVRGTETESRTATLAAIDQYGQFLQRFARVKFNELAGGHDPVSLDSNLVRLAVDVIKKFDIGTCRVMPSAAGHDARNSAEADIPTVMIFCPSRNEGKAHHPDAYSTPEDLENGARALAALTAELCL